MRALATAVTLLLLAATIVAAAAAAANIALPGCPSKCGELDIPYPFGTTPGCYRPGFMVTCNPKAGAGVPQLAKLGRDGPAVLEISVANSTVRIRSDVRFFDVGDTRMTRLRVIPDDGGPFVVHPARNRIAHVGCGFRASSFLADELGGTTTTPFNVCRASCRRDDQKIRSGRCRGTGCCDAPIPRSLTSFRTQIQWTAGRGAERRTGCSTSSPWITSDAAVVVVEKRWWQDEANVNVLMMSLLGFEKANVVVAPAVLDWSFDNSSTCGEAAKTPSFGCVSRHSECIDGSRGGRGGGHLGYVCKCVDGYQGNPYVTDGCQRPSQQLHLRAGKNYI